MIMGLACTMGGWNPQLDELLAEDEHGQPLTQVRRLSALLGLFLCAIPGCCKTCFRLFRTALPQAIICEGSDHTVGVSCGRPAE